MSRTYLTVLLIEGSDQHRWPECSRDPGLLGMRPRSRPAARRLAGWARSRVRLQVSLDDLDGDGRGRRGAEPAFFDDHSHRDR